MPTKCFHRSGSQLGIDNHPCSSSKKDHWLFSLLKIKVTKCCNLKIWQVAIFDKNKMKHLQFFLSTETKWILSFPKDQQQQYQLSITNLIGGLICVPAMFEATHVYSPWCSDTLAFTMMRVFPLLAVIIWVPSIWMGRPSFCHDTVDCGFPRGGAHTNSGEVRSATYTNSSILPNFSLRTRTKVKAVNVIGPFTFNLDAMVANHGSFKAKAKIFKHHFTAGLLKKSIYFCLSVSSEIFSDVAKWKSQLSVSKSSNNNIVPWWV